MSSDGAPRSGRRDGQGSRGGSCPRHHDGRSLVRRGGTGPLGTRPPASRAGARRQRGAFLDALESAGRGAGLTQKVPIADAARRLRPWERAGARAPAPERRRRRRRPPPAACSRSSTSRSRASRPATRAASGRPSTGCGASRRSRRRSTSTAARSSPASSASGSRWRSSAASAWTSRSGCSSWPSTGSGEERRAAGRPARADLAPDRRLPAREPAPLRQRRPHRRRRLRARPAGHQPPRARGGGGASPPRARRRAAVTTARRRSSRSRWRTTTSSTSNAQEMLDRARPQHAARAGGATSRSPGRRARRQSVTGRPSASAARRTISRSLG